MSINVSDIKNTVAKLCMDANYLLNPDIEAAFSNSLEGEENETAVRITKILLENAEIARRDLVPICQDTGVVVVFVEIGQDVHIAGGDITEAINEGVREGYELGFLRKSVVADPIRRKNTNDNTPAVVYFDIVPGNELHITVAPKGFGSENMSALKMLKPSDGLDGVKNFVIETVKNAGSNPCPPIIVGVGIGGTMDKCALIAKKALLRPVGSVNPDPLYAEIEKDLLDAINALGIGPAGLGGRMTAMAVHVNIFGTHIAGLPVAVNIGCHVTRHAEATLVDEGGR